MWHDLEGPALGTRKMAPWTDLVLLCVGRNQLLED